MPSQLALKRSFPSRMASSSFWLSLRFFPAICRNTLASHILAESKEMAS